MRSEIINEETHEVTKSDFFSKRTVKQFTEITRVDTPQEALFVSVDTLGKLDIPYMAKLCGKEPDEVIDALKADNLIYLNPKKADPEKPYEGWEEASEYLSGNVRVKLRAAERAAEGNPELQRNVDALTAVIPQKLEAGDITARIGVHWVDVEDYQKFLQEYAKAHFAYGEPLRRAYNGEYKIPFKGCDSSKAANLLVEKVMEIYTQTTPQKGVQAIFCDIAVHGDNETEELSEGNEQNTKKPKAEKSEDGKFSVYNYIKAELIRRGVPADEICFAGDANTVKKQNEMKAQLRSGTKRIVLSSTSKLGTGANIQNKLVALHNLDIPWKPSDLEQRLSRIVRQGNENDEVGIYNYVTKDTFDAYMMNIIVYAVGNSELSG